MQKLTERQKQVLGAIWAHIRSNGIYPSYSDIMSRLGIKSKQTIADFFLILERKGYISRESGKERGMSLSAKAISFLVDEGTTALGVHFYPTFSLFPENPKINSTCMPDNPKNEFTSIKAPVGEGTRGSNKPQQLPLLDYFDPVVDESRALRHLSGTINNLNLIIAQNVNFNYIRSYEKKEWSLISRIKLSLKTRLDKLFDLFK